MTKSRAAELSVESLMAEVADEFIERLNRGEQPEVEEYARRYPQIATFVRQMFPTLMLMRQPPEAAGAGDVDGAPGFLGDYRIVREVGHGGMGVVYEAVQESLGRRVALKVLPFASALDARQLQRFKNEAHAAAQLHHEHIVPVYAVGCERGVHFYAMQFIEGQTLATMIEGLRPLQARSPAGGRAPADTPRPAGALTDRSARDPAYFRTVAGLGVQAAEALEHAHGKGVIHRDVKPENLMVDGRGNLWVTDFGLAQVRSDTRLTLSGNVVGTLRYMSPEQALGQREAIDPRSDVHALGATLYELLTLRPAFDGGDYQDLLRRIAYENPRPPRRLNPAVPAALENIVLKAMAKDQADRYGSARELADDLRRFLEDRPVMARRPTLRQHLALAVRRHWSVVVTATVVAFLGLATTTLALAFGYREKSDALAAKSQALEGEKEARGELQKAYDDLAEQQRQTRLALHYHRLALAERELRANFVDRAAELLAEAPGDLRHWEWHYLKRLCHPELDVVRFSGGERARVALADEGKYFAVVDGTFACVWAVPDDGGRAALVHVTDLGAPPRLHGLAVSADGRRLNAPTWEWPVSVRELNTGRLAAGYASDMRPLGFYLVSAFAPDGTLVAAATPRGLVVLDVTTGEQKPLNPPVAGTVTAVAFSPNGRRLAAAYLPPNKPNWEVAVLDMTTRDRLATLDRPTLSVQCLAFNKNGTLLAVGDFDRTVRLWDLASPAEPRLTATFHGHAEPVVSLAFHPGGNFLASGSGDRTIRVWSLRQGQEVLLLRGHTKIVRDLRFTADGKRLVSESADGTVRLWDATGSRNPRSVQAHAKGFSALAFSPGGDTVVTLGSGEAKGWDIASPGRAPKFIAKIAGATAAAFAPGGLCRVLSQTQDGWQIVTVPGEEAVRLEDVAKTARPALAPDASWVLVPPEGGSRPEASFYRRFDSRTGREAGRWAAPPRFAASPVFDHDGGRFVVSADGRVIIHDARTGAPLGGFPSGEQPADVLAFSRDGRFLAAAAPHAELGSSLEVRDAATGAKVASMRGHPAKITDLAYSPDGRRLASCGRDGTVKLWDTATGQELLALRDHSTPVSDVAFSPDGRFLASGGNRGLLIVRDGQEWADPARPGGELLPPPAVAPAAGPK